MKRHRGPRAREEAKKERRKIAKRQQEEVATEEEGAKPENEATARWTPSEKAKPKVELLINKFSNYISKYNFIIQRKSREIELYIIYFFNFLLVILTCLLLIVMIVGVCEEPGLQKER